MVGRQEKEVIYANYGNYFAEFDRQRCCLSCGYAGIGYFIQDAEIRLFEAKEPALPERWDCIWEQPNFSEETRLVLSSGENKVEIGVSARGIRIAGNCGNGPSIRICGGLQWGDPEDCFAGSLTAEGNRIRSASGPAAAKGDDTLFCRKNDSALKLAGENLLLFFDYAEGRYRFEAQACLSADIRFGLMQSVFCAPYTCINKQNVFPRPPAGWMSWYAVKFDACEEIVLENARWQREHLFEFGANALWVDWEWYHSALSKEGPKGIHFFSPDPVRYPNGMKFLADELKKMGLTPVLWIGPTVEPTANDFIQNHSASVLSDEVAWCGKYFFDLTDEAFLNEYIPACCDQIRQWGFEAVKWDCLPVTLRYADKFHGKMRHPEETSEQALRKVISKVRSLLGERVYMLSCSGATDRAVLFAADLFDGARIGDDIFSWEEFLENFVQRIARFYPLHNVQFYCDPDNLVVRPEWNSFDQAVTRASLAAVLGLPITFGDDLPRLPADRVEILKRCIPPVEAHPMAFAPNVVRKERALVVNLFVSRSFGQWNVVDVANLSGENMQVELDFKKDLQLEGEYAVYSYWEGRFLGEMGEGINLSLAPYASKILSFHRIGTVPEVIGTSRHVTQGGVDLIWTEYHQETETLSGVSEVVRADRYEIRIYDPRSREFLTAEFTPEHTGRVSWKIELKKKPDDRVGENGHRIKMLKKLEGGTYYV